MRSFSETGSRRSAPASSSTAQGAVPRLRVGDDRVPLLRLQRSLPGGEQGLTEEHYAAVLDFETSDRYDPAEKAALRYTSDARLEPGGRRRGDLGAACASTSARSRSSSSATSSALTYGSSAGSRRWHRPRRGAELGPGPRARGGGGARTDPARAAAAIAEGVRRDRRDGARRRDRRPRGQGAVRRYLAEDDERARPRRRPGPLRRARARGARVDARRRLGRRARRRRAVGRLRACFTEPELVELGYFIAFTLGQSHWLATLGSDRRAEPRPDVRATIGRRRHERVLERRRVGDGVSSVATIQASSRSCSAASATAPSSPVAQPPVRGPSSTASSRFVLATDASTVSRSSGRSVRRSTTSASIPSPASCRRRRARRARPCRSRRS